MHPDPAPSVGRIVHYYDVDNWNIDAPQAAIVTAVRNWIERDEKMTTVDLFVMHSNGFSVETNVSYSAEPLGGCWNWPPRV